MKIVRRVSRGSLAVVLFALLALAGASLWSVLSLPESLRWVERARDIIAHLDAIERAALQAESARRGYLLRGNSRHREAFTLAEKSLRAELAELKPMFADDVDQQRRLADFELVVAQRLSTWDESMAMMDTEGAYTPRQEQLEEVSALLRNQLMLDLGEMRSTEHKQLQERLSASNSQIRLVTAAGAATGITALLLMLGAGTLLIREVRRRAEAQVDLARANGALEVRVEERTRELKHAIVVAEAASRAKSSFLANISHEFRTPLNSIIGFAELLTGQSEGRLSAKEIRYAGNIATSGRHLLRLVTEILDWAKLDAGRLELDRTSVEMGSLLDSCRMNIEPIAAKKGISVTFDATEQANSHLPHAIGDSGKIRQIVDNLLSNAVKFTNESGHVHLSASVAEATGEGASHSPTGLFVEVAVKDDGIGIAPADRERIFEAFAQVDTSAARRAQGTGLGLAVAQRLAELHGGTISVESEPGCGSCFRFRIPAIAPPTDASASSTSGGEVRSVRGE